MFMTIHYDDSEQFTQRVIGVLASPAGPATRPEPSEPRELLRPGHVALEAETVLGLEVALADALETRENVERHRMELLVLISGARVPPAGVDLFALERGLDPLAGGGLPRDAEKQLLEVVRELIRWRTAAGQPSGEPCDAT
jgi:hypothetical protein